MQYVFLKRSEHIFYLNKNQVMIFERISILKDDLKLYIKNETNLTHILAIPR